MQAKPAFLVLGMTFGAVSVGLMGLGFILSYLPYVWPQSLLDTARRRIYERAPHIAAWYRFVTVFLIALAVTYRRTRTHRFVDPDSLPVPRRTRWVSWIMMACLTTMTAGFAVCGISWVAYPSPLSEISARGRILYAFSGLVCPWCPEGLLPSILVLTGFPAALLYARVIRNRRYRWDEKAGRYYPRKTFK